jgi:hypothetical protein
MHPFGACLVAGRHDRDSGDRAAQSGHRARPGRLMRSRELTRGWRPSRLAGRTGAAGVGEQVAGAGQQLAGDRRGGDLRTAAPGDALVAGGELRCVPGLLRGLAQDPADPDRALPGMCPCRTVRSLPRTVGVSPAQDASLRAEANRVMSPISASRTSAVNGPTPGSWVKTLTRGSDLACWRTSASSRPVTDSRASMSARASEITSAETAGRSSEASHSRPGPLQQPAGRSWPWSARTAWIRFCSSVRSRTSCARCRSSARSWRTAGGAIHASGSRSARSSCARIAAPALVVLQPRRGDRLALQRVHQMRLEAVILQQPGQPSPAERGLERRLGAGRQAADHRQDRLHAVVHVAVGEHLAILVDDRHLGALAVDVDSDVDRHCRSPFRAFECHPGASLYRAEQERGPACRPGPHRVRTTSTGERRPVNAHAKSRPTLEPLRTLRPEAKGQAGACPDRTRAIPCTVRVVTAPGRRWTSRHAHTLATARHTRYRAQTTATVTATAATNG